MPACARSDSTATEAPVTAFPTASNSLKVTATCPTRAGWGEISCSIVTVREESAGLEQAVMSAVATQAHNRRFRHSLRPVSPSERGECDLAIPRSLTLSNQVACIDCL